MSIEQLPSAWEPTRATLQKYAHALTAVPRAAAPSHPRWAQVAMDINESGLVTAATPLADGTQLVSTIDLQTHEVVITAGDTVERIDMTAGPSPKSVGEAVLSVASSHGSTIDADASRYEDDANQEYDAAHATAFLAVAASVVEAFDTINSTVSGEITGPHLWPHGFDIATEWYSAKMVDYDGTPTSAQIAIGWYPAGDAYFYANPWPFDDGFLETELPQGATWNTEGWYGAKLDVGDVDSVSGVETVVSLGNAVHGAARDSLAE
ncbi:MAG: DUF5996 family protein [Acidimicrobiia bacterium]